MKMIQQIWDHLQVPYYEIPIDKLEQPQNSRDYTTLDIIHPTSKFYLFLQRFYDIHNQQLVSDMMKLQHEGHPSQQELVNQATYDTKLFDHHWGPSSIQWTA